MGKSVARVEEIEYDRTQEESKKSGKRENGYSTFDVE
jgi:hypothetical protein